MKEKIIIIGNGMVGYKFCEKMADKGGLNHFDITVFGEEPRPAYDRVHLSAFFDGKTANDLLLAPKEWYADNNIKLFLGDPVITLNRENKSIRSKSGKELFYDKLIFATGSNPFVPPIPGIDKRGVFVYRTIEDLERIESYSKGIKSAAVIGGGLLGLEAAKALVDLNLETHVVEFASRLMPRQIDEAGSDCLKGKIEDLSVSIHLNKNTKNIAGENSVNRMEFLDESFIDVEMVVVSAGIKPRDDLAKQSGLSLGPRGGIIVDNNLQTSDEFIFAIGECALYNQMIYGLIAPGYMMADVVVSNLLNSTSEFTGADMSTKLKLMGIDVASFGDPFLEGDHLSTVEIKNDIKGVYKKILVNKENNLILGGILVGDASDYGKLLQMYQNQMKAPDDPATLLIKASDGAVENTAADLPDTATICSCENITKKSLVMAIENGTHTISDLKKVTKSGTDVVAVWL